MKYKRITTKPITENYLMELLIDRGIINTDNSFITNFFNPKQDIMISSYKLDHIEEGVDLLIKHINNHSKILLPVDPDVDGFTSAATLINYFITILKEKFNFDFEFFYRIPEGKEHGLKTMMDELTKERKYDLIIMADSSSNDYDEHKILKDLGYDIIVLDHHEADRYSESAIVINNQLSQNYENKFLSGVGVVYKFLQVLDEKLAEMTNIDKVYYSNEYLDLVSLGMISDMMKMTTLENRFICQYGLSNIKNQFFKEIIEKQSYSLGNGPLTQIGVAFYITPLINALIRVGSETEKLRLFESFIYPDIIVDSTKRGEKGQKETIVTQSIRNCVNAKAKQNREKEKAIDLLNIQIIENCLDDNKILVLNADELNVSNTLTGLCAMGVAAEKKKPVMLGRLSSDGYLKGSIRGREDSELKDFKAFLLESGFMDYVEGHSNAAGFSIKESNIDKLNAYANEKLKDIDFNEGFYEADFIVRGNCSYLQDLILDLENGKPLWGQGNKEPIIIVENIPMSLSHVQVIGSNSDTLKIEFNGICYIKFKAEEMISRINSIDCSKFSLTIAGRPNVNKWGGRSQPQIFIDEMEINLVQDIDF